MTYAPPRRPLTRKAPAIQTVRRPPAQHGPGRRKQANWRGRLMLGGLTAIVLLLGWAAIARRMAPASNTSLTRFDAIIVLGYPADTDGNPSPEQLAHVNEAVREYEKGVAPRLILAGGAAHNRFVEAHVMARTAHAEGIPESALFVDPDSKDTIQNACHAVRIMNDHGWRSAEVVSGAWHLPRAGMIFSRTPIEWRAHAAPPLTPESPVHAAATTALETLKTVRYLVWARQIERCEP